MVPTSKESLRLQAMKRWISWVIILGVMELELERDEGEEGEVESELIAVCKLSNGKDIGDGGYIYVSLATLYTPIGVDEKGSTCVHSSTKPMHLLSSFVVLIYKEKGEREGGKEGEKKDEAEEDKKEDDRDQSDQPKPKRQHLSKPTRPSSTTFKSYPRSKKTRKASYSDGDTEDLKIQANSSGSEYKEIDLPDTNLSSDFIRKAQKARKSKKASKNVELSRSSEVRSSVQTMKKNKDSVTNSTKQAYKSSEGKKCKSGTEGRSQKRQRVTSAEHVESEKEEDIKN